MEPTKDWIFGEGPTELIVDLLTEDGELIATAEFPKGFKEWFKREENLKRFSSKRLEKWIVAVLTERANAILNQEDKNDN